MYNIGSWWQMFRGWIETKVMEFLFSKLLFTTNLHDLAYGFFIYFPFLTSECCLLSSFVYCPVWTSICLYHETTIQTIHARIIVSFAIAVEMWKVLKMVKREQIYLLELHTLVFLLNFLGRDWTWRSYGKRWTDFGALLSDSVLNTIFISLFWFAFDLRVTRAFITRIWSKSSAERLVWFEPTTIPLYHLKSQSHPVPSYVLSFLWNNPIWKGWKKNCSHVTFLCVVFGYWTERKNEAVLWLIEFWK